MAEYTLPNGRVIRGLSDGYTPEQIKQIAINGGYATEQDYQVNRETGADWLTTAGEMGGGVGGAMGGAALGTAIAPGVGTMIGGIVGGALGTFAGSAAGQTAEAAVENRDFSAPEIMKEAGKAAAVDAAFGMGGMVAGKVIKAIASPLMRLASPGAKVTSEVDQLINLQGKLEPFKTTLLPSQVGDTSMMGRAAETYAASSIAFRPEYNRIVSGYDDYVTSTTDELMKKLQSAPREEIGKAFTELSDNIKKAVDEVVDPLYKDIDLRGGLVLNSAELKDRVSGYLAQQSAGGVGRTSAKASQVLDMVSKLPATMTPAEMAANMPNILETARRLGAGDAQANGAYQILKGYVERVKNSPALVDTSAVSAAAKAERVTRVGESGNSRIGGEYQQAVNYVSDLRRKMSFTETRKELSYLKQKLRDMESPTSPNSSAAGVYQRAVASLENAMETSAKSFDKELYNTYRYTSDFYRKSQETLMAPFIKKALQNDEPAKVGELLARVGYVTPIRELDSLVKMADELGVKGGKDLRSQITSSYLENIFQSKDAAALAKFNKDMLNPKFRDTFMAVVPKDVAAPLQELAQEAEILARHASGGAGASLGITSREIGAFEKPGTLKSIVYAMIPNIVKQKQLNNKVVMSKLNAIKLVNEQIAAGKPPSQAALRTVLKGLPTTATAAGFAAGAAVRQ